MRRIAAVARTFILCEIIVSFYRNLDDGNPFLGVFLVPGAVDVAEARVTGNAQALGFKVGRGPGEGLVETVVWTYMLET